MGLSERGIQTIVNGKELTEARYEGEGKVSYECC